MGKAISDGYEARYRRTPKTGNPYAFSHLAKEALVNAWAEGWQIADSEIQHLLSKAR